MKVAVVGCGAVGSFYGAKLALAGLEVHFLLRSDFQQVRRNGVTIESREGKLHANPICAIRAEDIGCADLVIVALKTTANNHLPHLLPPLVDSRSSVLTLQNGLGSLECISQLVPTTQILGGLCFVCLNRIAPGVIRHIDQGLIVMGEHHGLRTNRTIELAGHFNHAGISCRLTDNLQQAQWEKLVWNIPFNGLGVAAAAGYESVVTGVVERDQTLGHCLPTDALLADPKWELLVRKLMLEVIGAARAQGLVLEHELADKQIARTRSMGTYYASTLLDFEKGLPLELESIFLEPQRQAKAAGAAVPRLEALYRLLRTLHDRRCGSAD